ncbi:transposase [Rhodoblastus acidophilus]|uniref:Transposase n=2 Tax=Candidatus Rhodoblastus alkanivorans TaxID=2954117 RepID=A0ABS9ZFL6_9HYPH|nr:IS66 family insertion sequence element accessory protein TnpB [Candidatus Rhodoblastus alkanivorans]MCI4680490.1 transposase [Candidatus Rhodoblastus alkanivorans]MCI4684982.1 transposase [Candidatus Rhodoblastus alkanivorans]MDI4643110.1 transposase [Rhodoblastus acidophilus]
MVEATAKGLREHSSVRQHGLSPRLSRYKGACLFTKRFERGRFLWPSMADGVVTISTAQLSYLLSGIDWRMPQKTWRPETAGWRAAD